MLYEGMEEEALRCIQSIRDRHDGAKRNPFSEPECGHHYARSMASWASILAWSGFHYSGVEQKMEFTDRVGEYFWSNGYAWGTCKIEKRRAILKVLYGELSIKEFCVGEVSCAVDVSSIKEGCSLVIKLK